MQQLRLPADRGGADQRAQRQAGERVGGIDRCIGRAQAEDQRVARVLARQRAGQHDAGRQRGLQVLQAVHREVDAAVGQRLVDLLGEQALAADVGQAAVLHRVAGGADRMLLRTPGQTGLRSSMNRRVWISASGEPRVPTRSGPVRDRTASPAAAWRWSWRRPITLAGQWEDRFAAMRPVLGIETSCDETAAAVLDEHGRVLARRC